MEKPIIYVVEDDDGICRVYEGAFEEDYEAHIFTTGKDFFAAYEKKRPNLVILDVMLPDMDGYAILTGIRNCDALLPVIMCSAKSDEISCVKGLNKGADGYVKKPFSVLELLATVKAALRRSNLSLKAVGDVTVDENLYKAFYKGTDLNLTLKEYMLLKTLVENAGVTITREQLFRRCWGEDFMGETRTLDMHLSSVRDKIKEAGGSDCIVTVRGVGYRYEIK